MIGELSSGRKSDGVADSVSQTVCSLSSIWSAPINLFIYSRSNLKSDSSKMNRDFIYNNQRWNIRLSLWKNRFSI